MKSGSIILRRDPKGEPTVVTAEGEELPLAPGEVESAEWGADFRDSPSLLRLILHYYQLWPVSAKRVETFARELVEPLGRLGGELRLVDIAAWHRGEDRIDRGLLGQVLPAKTAEERRAWRVAAIAALLAVAFLAIFASLGSTPISAKGFWRWFPYLAVGAFYASLLLNKSLRTIQGVLVALAILMGALACWRMLVARTVSGPMLCAAALAVAAAWRLATLSAYRSLLRRMGYVDATRLFAAELQREASWRFGFWRGRVLFGFRLRDLPPFDDLGMLPLYDPVRPTRSMALAMWLRARIVEAGQAAPRRTEARLGFESP